MINADIAKWLTLAIVFGHGFLISRLVVRTELAEALVRFLSRAARGNFFLLLFFIVGAATLLSAFIPNVITMLTFLPVLATLAKAFSAEGPDSGKDEQTMHLPLLLAGVYGANIGGTGSLIGSPANLLLLGFLQQNDLPIRHDINFYSWFSFSIPVVLVFTGIAWLVLVLFFWKLRRRTFAPVADRPLSADGRIAAILSITTLAGWIIHAIWQGSSPEAYLNQVLAAVLYGAVFPLVVLFAPMPSGRPLLYFREIFGGVPGRSFLFLGLLVVIVILVLVLDIQKYLSVWFDQAFSGLELSIYMYSLVLALVAIFSTEIINNTTVAVVFFPIVTALSQTVGLDAAQTIAVICISSTCAFMSPVATPVNAVAFGAVPKQAVRKVAIAGAVLNTAGAAWLAWAVPRWFHF